MFCAEVTDGEPALYEYLASRAIAIDLFYLLFYLRRDRWFSSCTEECIGWICWKFVTFICWTRSTILFTNLKVLRSILNVFCSIQGLHL